MRSLFLRLFPTPYFLRLKTVGLDFSDSTLRIIELSETSRGIIATRSLELPIPQGAMEAGRVVDEHTLKTFLTEVRKTHRLSYARVSISEPQIYFFTASFDQTVADDLRNAIELVIEEYIPLKANETVFDFVVVATTDTSLIVQVTAMSSTTSETFTSVLTGAGIYPVSFELEGQAIARAIVPRHDHDSSMIVDFGAHRTSIAIISEGTVVFTSTIAFGGQHVTEGVAKALSLSLEEAEKRKRESGLSGAHKDSALFESLTSTITALKDEIDRRLIYWNEKRPFKESFSSIKTIYLVGGESNLSGLDDYLRTTLRMHVIHGNPWEHCVSFDEVIPALPRSSAMSYTTAIGLALVDMPQALTQHND